MAENREIARILAQFIQKDMRMKQEEIRMLDQLMTTEGEIQNVIQKILNSDNKSDKTKEVLIYMLEKSCECMKAIEETKNQIAESRVYDEFTAKDEASLEEYLIAPASTSGSGPQSNVTEAAGLKKASAEEEHKKPKYTKEEVEEPDAPASLSGRGGWKESVEEDIKNLNKD